MARGRFITFEGGEGAGKTTQLRRLADTLAGEGARVVCTHEPGGTVGADQIRGIVKSGAVDKFDPVAEALLFFAARRDHVQKVIRPALEAGQWVISDRFADSTYVYQCLAGHLEIPVFLDLYALSIGDLQPDLTLVLDIDPVIGLARTPDGDHPDGDTGRFERKGLSYHQQIRRGYQKCVAENPDRCVLVDAGQDLEDVQRQIHTLVRNRFGVS